MFLLVEHVEYYLFLLGYFFEFFFLNFYTNLIMLCFTFAGLALKFSAANFKF